MMKMRYVAFLLISILALSSLAPDGAAQIKLNEVLADPNTDWDGDGTTNSKLDEWVEIMNVGTASVDLDSYRLTDESAGDNWRFALSGTLAPGAIRVFNGAEVVAWQNANGVSAFGLSLNNSGDTVYLYKLSASDTTVVDSYNYVTNEVKDDRSVGRLPDGSGAWVLFDGLNPYTGSNPPIPTGCFPSPGTATGCQTPTEMSTWGSMKSRYSG
jgi:hypothetical protein